MAMTCGFVAFRLSDRDALIRGLHLVAWAPGSE
ncbi:protein of unknown function [Blastococcus saxobsidens DD2]|uniref:Uncharacterized protein n=1 Tax=Blastococcus saxobsidens (strain DD2) TaxID=1146883 RepID=H6RUD0_BLASD|nr:protein of unknown function [Blastococcus saxobsidens DD2]